ncbi:MAG: hypothetical protein GY910_16360 [bacterium]|nr:hypothetical protein [bacterium]
MARRNVLVTIFLVLCMGISGAALSYEVEAGSASNSIFILLINEQPSATFHSISLTHTSAGIVSSATASLVPALVEASGSDLATLDFDVLPGAAIGSTGHLLITLSGVAEGKSLETTLTVPLEVVETAPVAQGVVGAGVPTPDPGGIDTDGDGVTDSLEVAFGSDPENSESFPGQPFSVPILGLTGVILLAVSSLAYGWAWVRAPRYRAIS